VSGSDKFNADVECEFANIAPGKEQPTWGTNCGNLVAAVALFAFHEGLVFEASETPTVRIWNRNSDSLIVAQVREIGSDTRDGYSYAGMTDTGSCVHLKFLEPVGTVQEKLLPTGNVRDSVCLSSGAKVAISIVDAGAMYVFVKAVDVGLTATESMAEMQARTGKMNELEFIRSTAAKLVGLVDDVADATHLTPDIPKLAFVSPATNHCIDASSDPIDASSVDLVSRIISSQKYHNAYAVTAAIATAAAATVPGSTVQEATGLDMDSGMRRLLIGHPTGIMDCSVDVSDEPGNRQISRARITRTARRIMEGTVFIPKCSTNQP
jgi:2-methylaconitate cis-trans-isomerase PrpF